jgi:hypothetical protein
MTIAGHEPIAVIDFHNTTITSAPARVNNASRTGGNNGCAAIGAEILPAVRGLPTIERIDAIAKVAGQAMWCIDRYSQRAGREEAFKLLNLEETRRDPSDPRGELTVDFTT